MKKYKISIRKASIISLEMLFLVLTIIIVYFFCTDTSLQTTVLLARFGTIVCAFSTCSLILIQKKTLTVVNLLFVFFFLFQFGTNIVLAFDSTYSNGYVNLFSLEIIIKAQIYSIISIQIFCIALSFFLKNNYKRKKNIIFENKKAIKNKEYIRKYAIILIAINSIVVLPLYAYLSLLTLSNGFSQQTRGFLSDNSIFNLTRSFFFSSCLLFLCFQDKNKISWKIVSAFFLISGMELLIIGTRTEGIATFFSWLYLVLTNKQEKKRSLLYDLFFVLVIVGLAVLSVIIANLRLGYSLGYGFKYFFESSIGEVGFNFTSICFVMKYVPGFTPFQLGLTYLESIILLYPSSLDFIGFTEALQYRLPVNWLSRMNKLYFGDFLGFGVGFSTNAEMYLNFGWFGFPILIFFAFIICYFTDNYTARNHWSKYVRIVLLSNWLTFPRRTFYEFLNSIEYSVFFIGLFAVLFYSLSNFNRYRYKRIDE